MSVKTVMLAAGGTGGHLFPAEALAEELIARGIKVVMLTDKRGHAFKSIADKAEILTINSATFKAGIAAKIKAVIDIFLGLLQSLFLIEKYRPLLVIGFGGYPSFPPLLAAQILRVKTILHEQNAVLGKANVWLIPLADAVAASLPETRGIKSQYAVKTFVTGNPVRKNICAVREVPYKDFDKTLEIFVTGGSQGAKIFSDVLPKAIALLPDDIKKNISVVQQCKKDEEINLAAEYKALGIAAVVKSFFDDMPERLASCHLFIGRSGASTVAEIAVVGRPAIFVPYQHVDRQQYFNAELLSKRDGAWIIDQKDFTPEKLAKEIEHLAKNRNILEGAAIAAKSCGMPNAVKLLADMVEERI